MHISNAFHARVFTDHRIIRKFDHHSSQLHLAMKDLAPEIFRKRLLVEGFFDSTVDEAFLIRFFEFITAELSLRTYAKPVIHSTGGEGKEANQGYDAFVPLVDSGIYVAIWSRQRFLSMVMYTCTDFAEHTAVLAVKKYFEMGEVEWKTF